MSLAHSPQIVTNGLVFYYDMGNTQKSWKGKPTENLLSLAGGDPSTVRSGSGYPFYQVNITSYVQSRWTSTNNTLSFRFQGKRNYVQGGTGGGGDGYPCGYVFFSDWSWAAAGGPSSYDWTDYTSTFTMPDPTSKSVYFAVYHMNSGNPGISYSRNHQVEFSSFPTPFVNGTRTNTQAILDLTNNNTITASSLTYNSDGSFSFNGSSNYIDCGTNSILSFTNTPFTLDVSFKITSYQSGNYYGLTNMLIERGPASTYNYALQITDPNTITFIKRSDTESLQYYSFSTPSLTNNTTFVTVTYNGSDTICLYLNGGLLGNISSTNIRAGSNDSLYIGGQVENRAKFIGTIYNTKIYNRALSADEIKQNFNALRGRFGI